MAGGGGDASVKSPIRERVDIMIIKLKGKLEGGGLRIMKSIF